MEGKCGFKKQKIFENLKILALCTALSVLIDCADFLLKCRAIITPGPSHVDEYVLRSSSTPSH